MSKGRFQLSETAAAKLEKEIEFSRDRYGARHGAGYKRDLLQAVRKISLNPKIYAERPEIGAGIRCVRFKGNYIVYQLTKDERGIIVLNFPGVREDDRL